MLALLQPACKDFISRSVAFAISLEMCGATYNSVNNNRIFISYLG